ncbi:ABC transporter [Paenibacillus sp. 32O-W]|uniref:ABC transporter ATP-binding protein n=1 Tax=Paenibacillus sp. 32O-W TaxID=1695218 RepID=UPI00071EA1D6|nr:ABC transporter ATP-binding protein [Paenibacillus sp. 32O-W]ALS29945.1 ABC transporter [Paenibacillus sp. 32O-W]
MNNVIMKASHLRKYYGGVRALDDFSYSIEEGKRIGLIGPNGAGKSTLFNLLSGAVKPTGGRIEIAGKDMTGRRPDQFSRHGVARTFQNIRLFKGLTVFENVLAGFHQKSDLSIWRGIFGSPSFRNREQELREQAERLLRSFGLIEKRDELAVHLSYGDQRRLEIVRAMATGPRILFLDEPAAGMNAYESRQLVELIRQLWEEHRLTVVLIEHDMDVVMKLCEDILVLDYGKLIFRGTPDEVRNSSIVREAYLGGEADA